jgi:hypothetical protein
MLTWYLLLLITSSTRVIAGAYIVRPTNGSPTLRRFLSPRGIRSRSSRRSSTEGDDDGPQTPPRDDDDDDDAPPLESDLLFLERFRRRRDGVASAIDAERSLRPPSARFAGDPRDAVASVLAGLSRPHDPAPHFGYEVLYASSTPRWREVLRRSVGASAGAEDVLVLRALGASIERPGNQFAILVRSGDDGRDDASPSGSSGEGEGGRYMIDFPQETLDYYDGSAWLECRLRDDRTDALLAVLGWSMRRREDDGAWLIDGIDWQDFRDDYRPGIGREEWERICG